ncbi:hypothetical protein V1512DRAFT_103587 [Lipomyces arxii]|uniref:uncharacterized protein n=1 Tax=Lipomyces arxii TaxID=56418 RepID=UPI0034CE9BA9
MTVSRVAWSTCKLPLIVPFRIALFLFRLVFWPVPIAVKFGYNVVNAILFPKPLVEAAGPLYFFFFIGISLGIIFGVCIGISSKVMQMILGLSQNQVTVTTTTARVKLDKKGIPQAKAGEVKTIPSSAIAPEVKVEEDAQRRRERAASFISRQNHNDYSQENKNSDRLFETFSSSSVPLTYIAVRPEEPIAPFSPSLFASGLPPTILEEEEDSDYKPQSASTPKRSYSNPSKYKDTLSGLSERDINIIHQNAVHV